MEKLVDRDRIRALLTRDPDLHLYEIGDLDPRFWPHTAYYAHEDAIALVYSAGELPVLLALDREPMRILPLVLALDLPGRIYAHLGPGLAQKLPFGIEPHGAHLKMSLVDRRAIEIETDGVVALSPGDLPEIDALYARAYPGNWFDRRMLETEQFYGVCEEGELVAIGGVHVYSPSERVAALGNIATAPNARGRGLARRVTARLCRSLLEKVDRIGLNVRADNASAIRCYEGLGFARVAEYDECVIDRGPSGATDRPAPSG